jgi:hypothetical protein
MAFITFYEKFISWVIWHAQFTPDKLVHVWAGMIIWLGVAVVLRRPLASVVPLAAVVLAEGGNEVIDYIHGGNWTAWDTVQDVFFTLFWPFAVSLAMRVCRWL